MAIEVNVPFTPKEMSNAPFWLNLDTTILLTL